MKDGWNDTQEIFTTQSKTKHVLTHANHIPPCPHLLIENEGGQRVVHFEHVSQDAGTRHLWCFR